jgi:DNA repair protein RadC
MFNFYEFIMSFKLEDVKGLGKKAENLKDAGIDSVEKLANAKVDDLLRIKGIGKVSAQKFTKKLLKKLTKKRKKLKKNLRSWKKRKKIYKEKRLRKMIIFS